MDAKNKPRQYVSMRTDITQRSVSGFVHLLQAECEGKLDAQADGWIRRTVQSIEQTQTLIRNLLDYSRVDSRSRPFEAMPFGEIFKDAAALLESSIRC
jgi:light-regulated signal transduction histidine kinase (bacteriophytochrome)